jgi:hypothetical protein
MTAAGISFFVAWWLWAELVRFSRWDWRAHMQLGLFLVGLILTVAGVIRWAWEVMP